MLFVYITTPDVFGPMQALWDLTTSPLLGDSNEGELEAIGRKGTGIDCGADKAGTALRLRGLIGSLQTQFDAINSLLQGEEGAGSSSGGWAGAEGMGLVMQKGAALQAQFLESALYYTIVTNV